MGSEIFFFFQAEDGIRYLERSRGLGDVYKRQLSAPTNLDSIEECDLRKGEYGHCQRLRTVRDHLACHVAHGGGVVSSREATRPPTTSAFVRLTSECDGIQWRERHCYEREELRGDRE